ncbi:MAG: hypothetical protein HY290_32670 [Planctomycetia bacterium]|nr:hypothetical protein [Planctomycetia bacterium]
MSSSISSSDHLPAEDIGPQPSAESLARERRFALWSCLAAPVLAAAILPVTSKYLLYAIYLTPAEGPVSWEPRNFTRQALALSAFIAAAPLVWLACLEIQRSILRLNRLPKLPWGALLAVAAVLGSAPLLTAPRVRWFFVEWCKIRTPNPSFARNTLFWEQRNFESAGSADGRPKIGLVGSSQVYAGFDLAQLAAGIPHSSVEKNCLAGFGPVQYPMLIGRLDERDFSAVVCMISAFDMFREDELPVNRLCWSANARGLQRLLSIMPNKTVWRERSGAGDLAFSCCCPMWRLREHFHRTSLEYWWDVSKPPERAAANGELVLAISVRLDEAKDSIRRNVQRTEYVDVNFDAFRLFARHLCDKGITLIVFEGQLHPDLEPIYPKKFRTETVERMKEMAQSVGFDYVVREDLPPLNISDFADGYHVNEAGRQKLTHALVRICQEKSGTAVDEASVANP